MGCLTDDMTRLCGEISALRNTRVAFIKELKHGVALTKDAVAEMQAGFRNSHARMARKTKDDLLLVVSDLATFVTDLKAQVSQMRVNLHNVHAETVRKAKTKRAKFISNLKREVAGLRQELAFDIKGARRALSGPSPAERKAEEEAERRRAEAERKAREEAEHQRIEAEQRAQEVENRKLVETAESEGLDREEKRKKVKPAVRDKRIKKYKG